MRIIPEASRLGVSRLGVSRLGVSRLGVSRLGVSRLGVSRLGVVLLGTVLLPLGCGEGDQPKKLTENPLAVGPSPFQVGERLVPAAAPAAPQGTPVVLHHPYFRDVHAEAGVDHVYRNGERGRSLMVETIGGGVGWLDYDGDGQWDLYLNQGGDPTVEADLTQPLDALFRNLGDGKFRDVTIAAGIAEFRYSQGLAVGDYDNDGFDDIYVTNVGPNTLWHNQGDGTFVEVSAAAGVGDERWSSSAAWGDLDLDGDLDLYVCNYCRYDPRNPLICRNEQGLERVCHPRNVEPSPDECYFNQGDGRFTPEASSRGLFGEGNRALGVAIADFNNDGFPDIYVANDTTANFLFESDRTGVFREIAMHTGCATDANGSFQASMGVAVSDFDRNGYLDIYVTHFYQESNTLYRNHGPTGFQDETGLLGLHVPTLLKLSFGVHLHDFDQNGLEDVVITSGHIENFAGNPIYKMNPQVLTYTGQKWFETTEDSGEFFAGKYVGRALAAGDYDNDGDLDLAIAHENSAAALLRNESERGHWVKFLMRGRESNRRGINCRVTVEAGPRTTMQELVGGTSYAASHQPALIFGLGDSTAPCQATVRWPSGRVQVLSGIPVDQTLVLDERDAHYPDRPVTSVP